MIYREEDGKQVPYVLSYFNGGVGVGSLKEAQQIEPAEEYWAQVMGLRKPDGNPEHYKEKNQTIFHYLTNYWVRKDLYDQIVEKCKEIGIPPEHADNLSIPLTNYLMTERLPIDKQIRSRAWSAITLKNLALELEKSPMMRLTKLTIEYGEGVKYNEETGMYELWYGNEVIIDSHMVLLGLLMELKRVLRDDKRFRDSIIESPDIEYCDFSYPVALNASRNRHLVIIVEYLLNFSVCKNKTDAIRKAGLLLSMHGFLMSSEEFDNCKKGKAEVTYTHYEDYVMRRSRERYNSFINSVKKKNPKR